MTDRPSHEHFWGRQMAIPTPPPPPAHGAAAPQPHSPYMPKVPGPAAAPVPRPPPPQPAVTDAFAEPVSVFSSAPPRGERINLYTEKRGGTKDSETYQDQSAAFSLITATERLENIWARRGAISKEDYEVQCEELIRQFGVLMSAGNVPKLDMFIAQYEIKASKAHPRLTKGVPATVLDPGHGGAAAANNQSKFVFRCTGLFHHLGTCIDMDQLAVGMLLPELTSLMKTLNGIKALGPDFEFNQKIRYWVEKLNSMPAVEELTQEEAKQFKLDLDKGYVELESAVSD